MNPFPVRRPAKHQSSRSSSAADMALLVIARLKQTLDAEIELIAGHRPIDYHDFNLRKSQALLELTRLAPALAGVESSPALCAAFKALRDKLEVNQHMLHLQLKAAREVADLIARAIQEGQSDSTYTAYAWRE